jgi:hypothetical protein
VVRRVRVPHAGSIDLVLLGPKEGLQVVIARSWSHAAAYAHVVGQLVGDVAHLLNVTSSHAIEFDVADPTLTTDALSKIRARIAKDAAEGNVGAIVAVGHTDADGEVPVKDKLQPVVALLHRWAALDETHVKLGIHLWTVRIGDTSSIEVTPLDTTSEAARAAAAKKKK